MNPFAKIIRGELPADKVYEDEIMIAIKDLYPQAPVHLLLIPRKEIKSLQYVNEEDLFIIAHLTKVAQKLAKEFGIADSYRFITNHGHRSGQSVFHLHFHLIGGKELGPIA